MINLETVSVVIFFAIIAILAYRDRKNIEFKYGLITRRTKKGKKWIYQFAEKHRKKLLILGNVAIVVCVGASIYVFSEMLMASYYILFKPEQVQQAGAFILPSVTGVEYPQFVIGVPFWYWIITIFLVLMAHEPMHGLLARAEKIRIKSFGLALFIALPGAFVEPDEKQIKKLSMLKKMRIYAAGSFGNFILAVVLALILNFGLTPVFFRGAVAYGYLNYTEYNLTEPFPAEDLNMTGAIISIDRINVDDSEDLRGIMSGKLPDQTILIETTEDEYWLTLVKDPKNETKGYMGIFVMDTKVLKDEYRNDPTLSPILRTSTELIFWVTWLNLGIGLFNLLPIKPLDGGLMFEEIVKKFFKKKWANKIVIVVSLFTLSLVLISVFGPSIIKYLG